MNKLAKYSRILKVVYSPEDDTFLVMLELSKNFLTLVTVNYDILSVHVLHCIFSTDHKSIFKLVFQLKK